MEASFLYAVVAVGPMQKKPEEKSKLSLELIELNFYKYHLIFCICDYKQPVTCLTALLECICTTLLLRIVVSLKTPSAASLSMCIHFLAIAPGKQYNWIMVNFM